MLQGLRTAIYVAPDLDEAKAWYSGVVGHGPYFDEPFYVGFEVGGFELGLLPAGGLDAPGGNGVIVYWGVENADAGLAHLLACGATPREAVNDVGGGIRVATTFDPYGNVLGLIENPHFVSGKSG